MANFLALPGELRNEIYNMYFESYTNEGYISAASRRSCENGSKMPAKTGEQQNGPVSILLASKATYHESRAFLMTNTRFRVQSCDDIQALEAKYSKTHLLPKIRYLVVSPTCSDDLGHAAANKITDVINLASRLLQGLEDVCITAIMQGQGAALFHSLSARLEIPLRLKKIWIRSPQFEENYAELISKYGGDEDRAKTAEMKRFWKTCRLGDAVFLLEKEALEMWNEKLSNNLSRWHA